MAFALAQFTRDRRIGHLDVLIQKCSRKMPAHRTSLSKSSSSEFCPINSNRRRLRGGGRCFSLRRWDMAIGRLEGVGGFVIRDTTEGRRASTIRCWACHTGQDQVDGCIGSVSRYERQKPNCLIPKDTIQYGGVLRRRP